MKKIIVPSDIKKKVRGDISKKIVKFVLYLAVAVVLVVLFAKSMAESEMAVVSVCIASAVALALCCWFSGVPLQIIDSSWYGKIIEVDVKDVKISKTFRERKREAGDSIQYVLVETSDKKYKTCEIYDDGRIYSSRARNYNLGDTVVHVGGCEYLRPMHHPDQGKVQVCVVCGFKSEPDATHCSECGHSLDIRLED